MRNHWQPSLFLVNKKREIIQMGMDVFGNKPIIRSEKPETINYNSASDAERTTYFDTLREWEQENPGVYFRANCWAWRPLHDLIFQLCGDLIDSKTMDSMGANDGAGPQTQKVCTKMASRFEEWMEHNTEGHSLDLGCHVLAGTGRFAKQEDLDNPAVKTETAYFIHDEHIKEFVNFLRECGGFSVC